MKYRVLLLTLVLSALLLALLPAAATTVDPARPTVTFTLGKPSLNVGDTQTVSWVITGGNAGPYRVERIWWYTRDAAGSELAAINFGLAPDAASASFKYLIGPVGAVELRLRDALGEVHYFTSSTFQISGANQAQKPAISATLDKASVAIGETLTATLDITGGVAPYKVLGNWYASTQALLEDYPVVMVGNTSSFTPVLGEAGRLSVYVVDAIGQVSEQIDPTFSITGSPAMTALTVTVTLKPTSVAVGTPVTATWAITGGEEPYTLKGTWQLFIGYDQHEWFDAVIAGNSSTFTPSYGTEASFLLDVTDAKGQTYRGWGHFFITGAATQAPIAATITLDRRAATIGSPITASWTVTGGQQPFTATGTWNVDVPGNLNAYKELPAVITGASSSFTPTEGSMAFLFLNIKMADGRNKTVKSQEFAINPKPSLPGDANGNQAVDLADLAQMVEHMLMTQAVTAFSNADMDGNGEITLQDLLLLIEKLV